MKSILTILLAVFGLVFARSASAHDYRDHHRYDDRYHDSRSRHYSQPNGYYRYYHDRCGRTIRVWVEECRPDWRSRSFTGDYGNYGGFSFFFRR